jgi:hypothetical protein
VVDWRMELVLNRVQGRASMRLLAVLKVCVVLSEICLDFTQNCTTAWA